MAGCLRSCLCNAWWECGCGCACCGCKWRASVGSTGGKAEKTAAPSAGSSTGLMQKWKLIEEGWILKGDNPLLTEN